jgi:uncharacterized repeat protein (TIGR01451 family)
MNQLRDSWGCIGIGTILSGLLIVVLGGIAPASASASTELVQAVAYSDDPGAFGAVEGDKLTLVFDGDLDESQPLEDVAVGFQFEQEIRCEWPNVGCDIIEPNVLGISAEGTFNSPRNFVGDSVTSVAALLDASSNLVLASTTEIEFADAPDLTLVIVEGLPDPALDASGWAGFTASLVNEGGAVPENVVLWLEVDGIDDAAYDSGLQVEFFDGDQWRHLGWGGASHWQLNRDAFFIGRDETQVVGFPIGADHDEIIPLRVNWPNGTYAATVTLESVDSGDGSGNPGERIYLTQSETLDVVTEVVAIPQARIHEGSTSVTRTLFTAPADGQGLMTLNYVLDENGLITGQAADDLNAQSPGAGAVPGFGFGEALAERPDDSVTHFVSNGLFNSNEWNTAGEVVTSAGNTGARWYLYVAREVNADGDAEVGGGYWIPRTDDYEFTIYWYAGDPDNGGVLVGAETLSIDVVDSSVQIGLLPEPRIHEGSTSVTRTLFAAPDDGQAELVLNYVLDENGLITGQAADDLNAQSPGAGAVPGFGFGEALAERPDDSVTHFVSNGLFNSNEWNTAGEVVTSAGNTGARWYLYVAREVNADGDAEVGGGYWIPRTDDYEFTIYWYAGDPDNGGVLVGAETLSIDVIDSSVQIGLLPEPRIHEGSTAVTDTVFGAPGDGEGELSLEYLLDGNGLITGQAADDLNAQSPGAGAVPGFGFGEALAERPDGSVSHFVSEGFLNTTPWNTSGEVVTSAGNAGARWYLYVAREVNADGDAEVGGGYWIPRADDYEFTIYWYVGDPGAGGLIVAAETLALSVIDNSQFQDELDVALAGFASEYARGAMESGSEQVVFDYTANAGDIEQVFNVFRLHEGGVEIDPATYEAIFESVSFDPNQIRGLSGTDASVVTAPGDLDVVAVEFLLTDDAPLGDYEIVITSYDVTGIDPNDVALGDTDSYRVLDTTSQAISLIQGPELVLDIDGPALLPLAEPGYYEVRLQNTGDADVAENVEVHFSIARPDIEPADVVVDWCADPTATAGDDCADWQPLALTPDNGSLSGQFGPSGGFPVDVDYDETTFIRASFTEPGNYDAMVDAVGADSEAVLATTATSLAVSELDFEIEAGVDGAVPAPDEGEGWAYFTATLVNMGDELPEHVALWVAVDGIGDALKDSEGLEIEYFDGTEWQRLGWAGQSSYWYGHLDRDAWFLGRPDDPDGTIEGFPVGAGEVFETPIRVNFDNAGYDLNVSVETADQDADTIWVYGEFAEQILVESTAVDLSLAIVEGLPDPALDASGWAGFTASLVNDGGAVPENVLLWIEVDGIDNGNVAERSFQYFDGSAWVDFGWGGFGSGDFPEMDREAYFIGRDGSALVGFEIPAGYDEHIPLRVDWPNGSYTITTSVESFVDGEANDPGERIYLTQSETLDVVTEVVAIPQARIHEGSTSVTRTLFTAPADGQGLMTLNYVLDENGLITGQAADDLNAQSPGAGAVPGFGFGEALAERPDDSVTHFVSNGLFNSNEWNTAGEVVTSAGNTGARWYLYVAREVNADGDAEVGGGYWIPRTDDYEFTIYWYAGDPDNGGVLVGAETLSIDVIDSSVQIGLLPEPRIHEGSTAVTDTVFGAPGDGEGELSLEYLLDGNGLITGQAADDLNAQSPGAGAVPGFGFGEALAERPDGSVSHFVSEGFLNTTPWNTSGEVVTSAGNAGARWYLYVAREVNADGDAEVGGGYWIPRADDYEFTIYWYVGDPGAGGLIVAAETLALSVIDNSQFQDELDVALAGFASEYARGAMESGSEQVVFDYTANAGDIEQVFNVFRLHEGGVEIDPATYEAIFESVSFDPNQIRGLSGTDASVVTAPGDLDVVAVEFLLTDDAPLGDYEIVITSYDVTGIDPNDVALGDTDSYRVLDTTSQAISLIQGPELVLDIDGPALLPLAEPGYYEVRLQNTGDADVAENVEVHFSIARPDIEPADVVVDWCADPTATAGDDCADWQPLALTPDNGSLSGQFGPSGGFPVDVDYDETTFIRASFTEPGNYDAMVDAVGSDSEAVLATTAASLAVSALDFEIEAGVDGAVPTPDEGEGWAYFTATLVNTGDELPEHVALWVAVDGIDDALKDSEGLEIEYFDGTEWQRLGWAGQSSYWYGHLDRDAWFLGRPDDPDGTIEGFPVGAGEVFETPIRVNFDNAGYDLNVSIETADQDADTIWVYGEFAEQILVESIAVDLSLAIVEGLPDPALDASGWAGFTASLVNDGGSVPENVLLWIEVDGIDNGNVAERSFQYFDGSAWVDFGWGGFGSGDFPEMDREAYFIGRDGSALIGFEIPAGYDEHIPLRVDWPNGSYTITTSVESFVDGEANDPGERIYLTQSETLDVVTEVVPMPEERILEGSTTVTDILFDAEDGQATLTLNFMLDENGYITGQAEADLDAQVPGAGGGSGVGYHGVWGNRPDASVTHVSWPWFSGELAEWREEGISPYMPIAQHDGTGWVPNVPSFGEWQIRWYAGDPDNGGVLVAVETLEVVVVDATVQIQAMPAARITEGNATITDVAFSEADGEATLTLNYLLNAAGYITGQAAEDLDNQSPAPGFEGVGYYEVWGDRPDSSVTHVRWPWFEGELAQWREEGIRPYIPVASDEGNGNWSPLAPSYGEWLVEWFAGDPNNGGLRVGAETLEVVVIDNSQFQDELDVALAGFASEYARGAMESGSEQVVFDYTANAGDIEQVFNVFRLHEGGVEIDPATYEAIFESVSFDPNQIRGLTGTDASVVTAPGDLDVVAVEFLLTDDAPLGDYEIVITSYDVTGIDPNDVALGDTDSYRVLDTASRAISLIQGPELVLDIDGPALLPLAEPGYYEVRLQNTGDAAVDENVEVRFSLSRAGIELGDVVVDYCIDETAGSAEACTDWAELTLEADNGSLSGRFGPAAGFEVDEHYDATTFVRAAFAEPGNYDTLAEAVGVDSAEVYAAGAFEVAITELDFEIEAGVDGAVPTPDEGEGWAYFTATLLNMGDELPENVLLWVDVDGIGDTEFDAGARMQWLNPATESWTDLAWGDHPDLDPAAQREAFFLGRDGDGNVTGFPVGDEAVFETPIRVNFDNTIYGFTTSVEGIDAEWMYGQFEDEVAVISEDVDLTFDIERGVDASEQPPRWDYFTATLGNEEGGATPDNIVLYVAVNETDFAAGDALEFWNGSEWQSFGWDSGREAWFLGRDGAGGVSGFPIDAGEVFEIEIRVNFLPDSYTATITVESFDDSITGVGGVYGEFVETVDVLPTPADISFVADDLVQIYDGTEKTVAVTTSPEADLDVEIIFDPASPIDVGSYTVTATVVDPYFEGEATETLVIEPAEAQVMLDDLVQVYDGEPKPVTVTTDPTGLDVIVTYDGSADVPVNAGSYQVVATIDDPNYTGEVSDVLTIEPAAVTIEFADLVQVYDGTPLSPTITTVPEGVALSVTYDGSPDEPVNAGSYLVVASVDDPNYQSGSESAVFVIEKGQADVSLSDLVQVYDGDPKPVTVATDPAGLNVIVTYDGSTDAPINAGSYSVVATVDDANWSGSASGVLTIEPAEAVVMIDDLVQVYDGDPKSVTVTTDPAGLDVIVTYDGSTEAPVNAGSYQVVATVDDPNHVGEATDTLVIEVAEATVTIDDLVQVYDGDPKAVTVATDPAGLDVIVTYDGSTEAPVNAGSYQVIATVDDPNHVGEATDTLVIEVAEATVTIDDLVQVYDGGPKVVTVITDPAGLDVIVTYDGSTEAPVDAGSYQVVATVDDPNHVGEATDTLVIEQGPQTIDFPALPDRSVDDSPFVISATATSGLEVEFSVVSGPATIDGNEVTLTGELGEVVIEATQPGDDNWLAADPVQQSFEVVEGDGNSIEAASATNITGQAGEPVAAEDLPTVRVLDQHDNPVSGVTVSFEVTSGAGSVSGATQVTDSEGLAQVGGWTLGSESIQTLTASAPGLAGSPVEFTAEVDAVVELDISITDNRETIEPGERNTYVITVSNAGPNDAEGAEVSVVLPPELVTATADWQCFAGQGASCTGSGSGHITDDAVSMAAGSSVIYVLEADVDVNATGQIAVTATVELDDVVASDITTTQIVITEDSIFQDRFEDEGGNAVDVAVSTSRVEGHLLISSGFRGGLPPRILLAGRDRSGGDVFRVRALGFDRLSLVRIEMRDDSGNWIHGDWMDMQPADAGLLGFEHDPASGLLILVGDGADDLLQARTTTPAAHTLYTGVPDQVDIVIE